MQFSETKKSHKVVNRAGDKALAKWFPWMKHWLSPQYRKQKPSISLSFSPSYHTHTHTHRHILYVCVCVCVVFRSSFCKFLGILLYEILKVVFIPRVLNVHLFITESFWWSSMVSIVDLLSELSAVIWTGYFSLAAKYSSEHFFKWWLEKLIVCFAYSEHP